MSLHGSDVMRSLQPIIDEAGPQIWEVKEQVVIIEFLCNYDHSSRTTVGIYLKFDDAPPTIASHVCCSG